MAIQMRRGNAANYDETKMLPGEFAVATDEEELYIAFATGNSKKVLTEDDQIEIDDAIDSTSENPVQNKVINTALASKANLASPTFTGTPKAPTASASTNNTQIATTKFVHDVADTKTKIWIGNCTTDANVQEKVVTVSESGFALATGTLLLVSFTKSNTVTSIRLNVNDTGSVSVYFNGTASSSAPRLGAYKPYLFIYRLSHWEWVGDIPLRNVSKVGSTSQVTSMSNRYYAVGRDSDGFLAVNIPWVDTHGALTVTDQGDGVVSLSIT